MSLQLPSTHGPSVRRDRLKVSATAHIWNMPETDFQKQHITTTSTCVLSRSSPSHSLIFCYLSQQGGGLHFGWPLSEAFPRAQAVGSTCQSRRWEEVEIQSLSCKYPERGNGNPIQVHSAWENPMGRVELGGLQVHGVVMSETQLSKQLSMHLCSDGCVYHSGKYYVCVFWGHQI